MRKIYIDLELNRSKPYKIKDNIFEYDDVELIVTLKGQALDLFNETLEGYYSTYRSDEPVKKIDSTHFTALDNNKVCLFLNKEVTKNIGILMLQVAIIDSQHFCTPYIAIPIRDSLKH